MTFQQILITTADNHPCLPANWNPCSPSAGSAAIGDELKPFDLLICYFPHDCFVIASWLHMQNTDSAQGPTNGSTYKS